MKKNYNCSKLPDFCKNAYLNLPDFSEKGKLVLVEVEDQGKDLKDVEELIKRTENVVEYMTGLGKRIKDHQQVREAGDEK